MITRRKFHSYLQSSILCLMGMLLSVASYGQGSTKSIFDVMNHTEVLDLRIEADFEDLKNNRRTAEYQFGNLAFSDEDKVGQEWAVKVRPRGKYRRRICEMPPLKIKFSKSDLAERGLNDFNDLKLVTHCVEDKSEAKELLMKEYLAYKLYNELTPNSFRVQMVKITYVDSKTGKKEKNWGFLIEDKNQVEDRLGAELCDCRGTTELDLDIATEEMMTVFQYMIGNEDWDLAQTKNLKMFQTSEKIIPVPYDFDFAGMVNAPYARASKTYGLLTVQQRAYFGTSQFNENLEDTKNYFEVKKDALYNIVKNFKPLSNQTRLEVIGYFDEFYANIDSIKKTEKIKRTVQPAVSQATLVK